MAFLLVELFHPGPFKPFIGVLKASDDDPKAGGEVAHYNEDDQKEEQTLEPQPYFQKVSQVIEHLAFLLEDFQNSEQSRKLDQFIQSANSGDTDQRIQF